MTIEKGKLEEILQLDIGEIGKDMLCSVYGWREENVRLDFLDILTDHLVTGDGEEYCYSEDSEWTEFFKSKILEWFGEEHGLASIDGEYWLLMEAVVDNENEKFWSLHLIETDNLDKAKKLVKLIGIVDEMGKEQYVEKISESANVANKDVKD